MPAAWLIVASDRLIAAELQVNATRSLVNAAEQRLRVRG